MLPPRFFALTPGDLAAGDVESFSVVARAAFDAGLGGILLREPALGDRQFLRLACALAAPARRHSAWLGVHDRLHCAIAAGADALHLGFRSLPAAAARALLPAGMALGLSTHAGDDDSLWSACDYRVHGPVFDTPSKRGWQDPIGVEGLLQAARRSAIPIWGIGGLLPEHATLLHERALGGLCARSSLFVRGETPSTCAQRVAHWSGALQAACQAASSQSS